MIEGRSLPLDHWRALVSNTSTVVKVDSCRPPATTRLVEVVTVAGNDRRVGIGG